MNKLKRYRLKINPKNGAVVDFISQVDSPAIERGFLKFKNIENFTMNEDKMELFGPVLIPDMPIYRRNEKMGEYEVYFTTQDIKDIQMNFMKSGYQNNINLDHTDTMASSYVFESFVSDDLVPNPLPYSDLPIGTWFVRVKVEDKNVWNDIKSGKRNGFSIEGMFEYIVDEFEKNFLENQFENTTNIYETQQKITLEKMLKDVFKKIFADLANEFENKEKMEEVTVEVKEEVTEVTEQLDMNVPDSNVSQDIVVGNEYQKVSSMDYKISSREIGQKVEMVDSNSELVSAPDGCYEFEDGFKFCVVNGLISEIDGQEMDMKMEEVVKYAEVSPETMAIIEGLQKTVEDLRLELESIKTNVPTQESMNIAMDEIKKEFRLVFEKYSQIPAEPSKIVKSNVVKDDNKIKMEAFFASLRK